MPAPPLNPGPQAPGNGGFSFWLCAVRVSAVTRALSPSTPGGPPAVSVGPLGRGGGCERTCCVPRLWLGCDVLEYLSGTGLGVLHTSSPFHLPSRDGRQILSPFRRKRPKRRSD